MVLQYSATELICICIGVFFATDLHLCLLFAFNIKSGPWVHPMIDNPEYVPNDKLYIHPNLMYVGFELWQVKSGTIFDNILVTDDIEYAKSFAEETTLKMMEVRTRSEFH